MARVPTTRAIPAAAGYPQYSGNLIHPVVSQELLERFYATTIFGSISTTQYLGELKGRGDQITFFRKPEVSVREHIKDGVIQHDTLEADTHTMVIDQAHEWSVKMAVLDESMMAMWPKFKAGMMESASHAMMNMQDRRILRSIYADAHVANQGAAAGIQTGMYNLGTVGAPLDITSAEQLARFLGRLQSVLNEQNVPREGRYVVLPLVAEQILRTSNWLALVGNQGGYNPDQILNGRLPNKVMGFDVYISHNLETVVDPTTNDICYYVIAGLPMATAYASVLENTRIIDNDKDSWDVFYQGLLAWGFDVIYPMALSTAYVTFDAGAL